MKNEKVDKCFELLYKNLSYRRKFIRTLCLATCHVPTHAEGTTMYVISAIKYLL